MRFRPAATLSAMDIVAQTWREYFENHRDEFAARFDEAAQLAHCGDAAGMAALMNRGNDERAASAAAKARAGG